MNPEQRVNVDLPGVGDSRKTPESGCPSSVRSCRPQKYGEWQEWVGLGGTVENTAAYFRNFLLRPNSMGWTAIPVILRKRKYPRLRVTGLAANMVFVCLPVTGRRTGSVLGSAAFDPDPDGLDFFSTDGVLAMRHSDCQVALTGNNVIQRTGFGRARINDRSKSGAFH